MSKNTSDGVESSPDNIGLSVEQSRFIFFNGMQRETQAFRHRHSSISFKCFFAEQMRLLAEIEWIGKYQVRLCKPQPNAICDLPRMAHRGLRPQPRPKRGQLQATSRLAPLVALFLVFVTLVCFCGKHSSFSCCLRANRFLATKRHKIHKRNNRISRESITVIIAFQDPGIKRLVRIWIEILRVLRKFSTLVVRRTRNARGSMTEQ